MDVDHSMARDAALSRNGAGESFSAIAAPIARWRQGLHCAIAEAAYFHAERRGFAPGHELDDWLAGEADITERLSSEGRQF
jgi:hypothetical protein